MSPHRIVDDTGSVTEGLSHSDGDRQTDHVERPPRDTGYRGRGE